MVANIREHLETIAPWNFSIRVGDQEYHTVRPTLGTICLLEGMRAPTADAADFSKQLQRVSQIFAEPKPDLGTWAIEEVIAAGMMYAQHFGECSGKNFHAIAGIVELAMADAKGSSKPAAQPSKTMPSAD